MIEEIQKKIVEYYGTDKWMDDTIVDIEKYPDSIPYYTSKEEVEDYRKSGKRISLALQELKKTNEYINYKTEQLLLIQNLYTGLKDIPVDIELNIKNPMLPTLSNIKKVLFEQESVRNILSNEIMLDLFNTNFRNDEDYKKYMLLLYPEIKKIKYTLNDIVQMSKIEKKDFSSFEKAYEKFLTKLHPIRQKADWEYCNIIEKMLPHQSFVEIIFNDKKNVAILTTPMAEVFSERFFREDRVDVVLKMTNVQKIDYINNLSLTTYRDLLLNFAVEATSYQMKLEELDKIKSSGDLKSYKNFKDTLVPVNQEDFHSLIDLWAKRVLSQKNLQNEEIPINIDNIILYNLLEKKEVKEILCNCLLKLKEKNYLDEIQKLFMPNRFKKELTYSEFLQYCVDKNFEKTVKKNRNIFQLYEPNDVRCFQINFSEVEKFLGIHSNEIFHLINSKTISINDENKGVISIIIKHKDINKIPLEKISNLFSDLIIECRNCLIKEDLNVHKEKIKNVEERIATKVRECVLTHLLQEDKDNQSLSHKRKKI